MSRDPHDAAAGDLLNAMVRYGSIDLDMDDIGLSVENTVTIPSDFPSLIIK